MMNNLSSGIICKVDINKAFDELDRNNALNHMINKVGNYKFMYKLKEFYSRTYMNLKLDFCNFKSIRTYKGVFQGYKSSQNIFTLVIDDILTRLNK